MNISQFYIKKEINETEIVQVVQKYFTKKLKHINFEPDYKDSIVYDFYIEQGNFRSNFQLYQQEENLINNLNLAKEFTKKFKTSVIIDMPNDLNIHYDWLLVNNEGVLFGVFEKHTSFLGDAVQDDNNNIIFDLENKQELTQPMS